MSAPGSRNLVIDKRSCCVRKGEKEIHLSPEQLRLLEFLMLHPGKVYTSEELIKECQLSIPEQSPRNTFAARIKELRRSIESNPKKPKYVVTVPGFGYKFDGESEILREESNDMRLSLQPELAPELSLSLLSLRENEFSGPVITACAGHLALLLEDVKKDVSSEDWDGVDKDDPVATKFNAFISVGQLFLAAFGPANIDEKIEITYKAYNLGLLVRQVEKYLKVANSLKIIG